MDKVIKVTDEEIFIGKSDGSVIKTEKTNAGWNVKVGDVVELFIDGDIVVPSLIKKSKIKRENKFLDVTAKLSQKIFIPFFTVIWALSLISLILLSVIPRGDVYLYKDKIMGVDIQSKMVFSDDGLEIEAIDENGEYKITSYSFKIVGGSLYVFDRESSDYEYWGKISSTKIKLVSGSVILELRETRLSIVKVVSIVLLSVFASLDLLAIVFVIIYKCKNNKLINEKLNKNETLAETQSENKIMVK